ncbi:hypothetical protein ASG60_19735 [Methylobacterium sp. Leaf469]|uniref:DUF805 domain-containing protein n=1 Tax=Methylobacterium sp. Leaf469 TaxID=1736387 RepID=UPI0007007A49|nr:DUF805 domain-containing protein [Methylobacterium sp. Leaf469]KQU00017.1 hypothetical protein ASG60_19735 [Methylobacterium sp. Leaf469]
MRFFGILARAFDPRGRMSAGAYRRVFVRTILYGAGLLCFAIWLAGLGGRAAAILTAATLPVVGLAMLAATARRLHDRDRSAGWLVPWGLAQAVGFAPLDRMVDTAPLLVIALLLAMLGFSAWFIVETLMRRGSSGANRFGPPDDAG